MGIIKRNRGNSKGAVSWQSVKTSGFTAIAGQGYFCDTTSSAFTVTLPASPAIGDTIIISDYGANSATNNITIDPNGNKILGGSTNRFIQTNKETVELIYSNDTKGWSVISGYIEGTLGLQGSPGAPTIGTATLSGVDVNLTFTAPTDTGDSPILSYTAVSNPSGGSGTISEDGSTRTILVTGLSTGTSYTFTVTATNAIGTSAASAASNSITTPSPSFIGATGGTVSDSGDFRIHSFTGDGCFVVSTAGLEVGPQGGPSVVDYLVVAGGGGGGAAIGGGGGGGGFREGKSSPAPIYSASPIVAPAGLTVTATTYPITVGGGGAGNTGACTSSNGGDSVFSTITSAGGGYGPGQPGGSGGGGGHQGAGGTGNTPPVSPSQGFPGGMNNLQSPPTPSAGRFSGAGGGGATQAGTQSSCAGYPSTSGPGGAGATTSISGSPTSYAGGGGGGGYANPSEAGGSGGLGGGGKGAGWSGPAGVAGTTNTGGGGGGGSAGPAGPTGYSGGSGIVILRYKFQ